MRDYMAVRYLNTLEGKHILLGDDRKRGKTFYFAELLEPARGKIKSLKLRLQPFAGTHHNEMRFPMTHLLSFKHLLQVCCNYVASKRHFGAFQQFLHKNNPRFQGLEFGGFPHKCEFETRCPPG